MKFLEEASLSGKRVFLRIVADVPLEKERGKWTVGDDYRLRQVLPTLHYVLDYGAAVVLASHLGRPNGRVDRDLSLRPVWLHMAALLKRPIQFAPSLVSDRTAEAAAGLKSGQVLALENLRFEPGEEKATRTFASRLARYADLYVNDAFGVSHRDQASITVLPELLPAYGGLLLEREVQMLSSLMRHPAGPYVAVVGGAKISDKLPAIKQLLNRADYILVGGGVANTLAVAAGQPMKDSLIDEESLTAAKEILRLGRGRLILPDDFAWEKAAALDIGPKTARRYAQLIQRAKTVFWTGPLGKVEQVKFQSGSTAVAAAIAASGATSIVGGGDTVAYLEEAHLAAQFSFVSTAGGATLDYLGGKALPGLKALG